MATNSVTLGLPILKLTLLGLDVVLIENCSIDKANKRDDSLDTLVLVLLFKKKIIQKEKNAIGSGSWQKESHKYVE